MTVYSMNCTIGADPEMFIVKDKKIIRSRDAVGKDKHNIKVPFFGCGNYAKIFSDGYLLEFNTDWTTCRANVANSIVAAFKQFKRDYPKYDISSKRVYEIPEEEYNLLEPDEKELGCEPDYNSYSGTVNEKVYDPNNFRLRSAGGHLHFSGYSNLMNVTKSVPLLDCTIGLLSVLLDNSKQQDRRTMYGKAGDYRLDQDKRKLEYRTLSNFWLYRYPLFSLVTEFSKIALGYLDNNVELEKLFAICDLGKVQRIINTNNKKQARKVFKEVLVFLQRNSIKEFFDDDRINCLKYLILKGVKFCFGTESILNHWVKLGECHHGGWETWCNNYYAAHKELINTTINEQW
jgi:hypothetical protein